MHQKFIQQYEIKGNWSSGMILVLGTRGPGFNPRIAPFQECRILVSNSRDPGSIPGLPLFVILLGRILVSRARDPGSIPGLPLFAIQYVILIPKTNSSYLIQVSTLALGRILVSKSRDPGSIPGLPLFAILLENWQPKMNSSNSNFSRILVSKSRDPGSIPGLPLFAILLENWQPKMNSSHQNFSIHFNYKLIIFEKFKLYSVIE
ncbi:hypothetical protein TTHERM_00316720 (macronuclear) [Tetrahymena thermophila SB210]|uniref:Uncharacterized protein n=1 Tax=Tetrahymena thermophila (strain SB210) TaxID=312017 RepID=I7ML39_TETTS|nr:hypothetical protein TTHERM_00316720 [Tetrahymena thermophila SB210]EAS01116.1 hypothetical protein TTHERM_00316720 [Tetrahymena thermophila SB210]|eukprot:XP_001021361.1 hypothetical protein TTHERM_00316720 [Tetrahymena thermophila SB210]